VKDEPQEAARCSRTQSRPDESINLIELFMAVDLLCKSQAAKLTVQWSIQKFDLRDEAQGFVGCVSRTITL
jgi:hypothetical protein